MSVFVDVHPRLIASEQGYSVYTMPYRYSAVLK